MKHLPWLSLAALLAYPLFAQEIPSKSDLAACEADLAILERRIDALASSSLKRDRMLAECVGQLAVTQSALEFIVYRDAVHNLMDATESNPVNLAVVELRWLLQRQLGKAATATGWIPRRAGQYVWIGDFLDAAREAVEVAGLDVKKLEAEVGLPDPKEWGESIFKVLSLFTPAEQDEPLTQYMKKKGADGSPD